MPAPVQGWACAGCQVVCATEEAARACEQTHLADYHQIVTEPARQLAEVLDPPAEFSPPRRRRPPTASGLGSDGGERGVGARV